MKQIKIQDEIFRKIKKRKAKAVLLLQDDECKDVAAKEKIELVNSKEKRLKRKVKSIKTITDLEELNNKKDRKKLGLKKKEELLVDYPKKDVDQYGLIHIEFYKKMRLLFKIILGIIIVVIFVLGFIIAKNKLAAFQNKKVIQEIVEVAKDKTTFLFVEINPKFVLTVKDNKISDIACMNDDCMKIYDDIKVVGTSVTESIENLYQVAKEKGFDTSKGVTIKSTGKVEIDTKKLDYVKVGFIEETEKDDLLKEVINNEEIKNVDNKNYYQNLWDTLKKDSDYGKIYDCEMKDGKLSCYMKKEVFAYSTDESWTNVIKVYSNYTSSVTRVFDKFDVSYELEEVIPNLVSDIRVVADYNGSTLKFKCDIDGECSGNLVDENGIYHNWRNHEQGGEIYSFTIYKDSASLDLLNPNQILNGLIREDDDFLTYDTAKTANFIYPDKYPLVVTDDSYHIGYKKKEICNINTRACTPYEYLESKWNCSPVSGGQSCNADESSYKKIDKSTYDFYQEISDLQLGYGGSTLDEIGSTDYRIKIDVEPPKYYRCKTFELESETCKELTKHDYDILTNTHKRDGKYIIEEDEYTPTDFIRTICEVNLETLSKYNCEMQYYDYERDGETTYFEYKYSKYSKEKN